MSSKILNQFAYLMGNNIARINESVFPNRIVANDGYAIVVNATPCNSLYVANDGSYVLDGKHKVIPLNVSYDVIGIERKIELHGEFPLIDGSVGEINSIMRNIQTPSADASRVKTKNGKLVLSVYTYESLCSFQQRIKIFELNQQVIEKQHKRNEIQSQIDELMGQLNELD